MKSRASHQSGSQPSPGTSPRAAGAAGRRAREGERAPPGPSVSSKSCSSSAAVPEQHGQREDDRGGEQGEQGGRDEQRQQRDGRRATWAGARSCPATVCRDRGDDPERPLLQLDRGPGRSGRRAGGGRAPTRVAEGLLRAVALARLRALPGPRPRAPARSSPGCGCCARCAGGGSRAARSAPPRRRPCCSALR